MSLTAQIATTTAVQAAPLYIYSFMASIVFERLHVLQVVTSYHLTGGKLVIPGMVRTSCSYIRITAWGDIFQLRRGVRYFHSTENKVSRRYCYLIDRAAQHPGMWRIRHMFSSIASKPISVIRSIFPCPRPSSIIASLHTWHRNRSIGIVEFSLVISEVKTLVLQLAASPPCFECRSSEDVDIW